MRATARTGGRRRPARAPPARARAGSGALGAAHFGRHGSRARRQAHPIAALQELDADPRRLETARSNAASAAGPGALSRTTSPRAPPRLRARAPAIPRRALVRQWMSRGSSPGRKARSPPELALAAARARAPGRGRRQPPSRPGGGDPAPGRRSARPRRRPRACAGSARTETWSPAGSRSGGGARAAQRVAVGGLLRAPGGQLQEVAALLDRRAPSTDPRPRSRTTGGARSVLERDPHQVGRSRVDRRRQHATHAQPGEPQLRQHDPAPTAGRPSSRTVRKKRLIPASIARPRRRRASPPGTTSPRASALVPSRASAGAPRLGSSRLQPGAGEAVEDVGEHALDVAARPRPAPRPATAGTTRWASTGPASDFRSSGST